MKAIVLKEFGSTDKLVVQEVPVPIIQEEEVLVKVSAISVNPVDVYTRLGKGLAARYQDEHPMILGWDISGEVIASKSPLLNEGQQVFGMVNFPGLGRAYAEYVAAPAGHLALKPENISYEEAAAATLAALTAWQALTRYMPITAGRKILIHAAAGGVGHYAVQIAKYLGAQVSGTASAANQEVVLGLGADEFIDYKTPALSGHAADFDYVLDTIGGDNIDLSLQIMKPGSTIISLVGGQREVLAAKAEAKGMTGLVMGVASNGADMQRLAELLQQGAVRSLVSHAFSFDQMPQAHQQVESHRTVGKVVVQA
ncbi:NADP-dependent oxidoreductase [Chitinophaga sp. 30R24]|uniref:NADP-dependent oxidoreductase n=1 Tax=Chitinophaga sp. 30R24 TaxID=3248838 RepID=UPI003B90D264